MRIEKLRLRSAAPDRLATFYQSAFGAILSGGTLNLGEARIEIVAAANPAAQNFVSNETGFQHFALVVADMGRAYDLLRQTPGWRPISLAGPEQLPQSSGGAAAFKFRDPEGHPLELLQFAHGAVPDFWGARFAAAPERVFHGVDHSGLATRDADASTRFWRDLGFVCARRGLNRGAEQARLDGYAEIAEAEVEIISLAAPAGARPGVELLACRHPALASRAAGDGDVAATEIVIAGAAKKGVLLRDPDGHRAIFSP
ncbi:VOC family protein [Rhodoblastus sp.]|uniref:VOC family protein n=1 Tax=Rhodoblastus sp. TaxID=1962975 RepID=UPI003F9DB983